MAKLSVVVPSNEVEVGGVKYRKVERKAQAGDIVRITDAHAPSYVINGAFYDVVNVDRDGDPQITDEDGDKYYLYEERFEVYEKVTEPAAVEYSEVKREAEVGERIRIVAAAHAYGTYVNGEEFTVTSLHGHGGGVRINRKWRTQKNTDAWVLHDEYVVLEPVNVAEPAPQPERLKVGEYAKIIGTFWTVNSGTIGDIVEILDIGGDRPGSYGIKFVKDGVEKRSLAKHLVRATESEVEAAKNEAKWAAIGRKVNEYKRGDFVTGEDREDGVVSGSVEDLGSGLLGVRATSGSYYAVVRSTAKLIVPVEQRFDKGGEVLSK